MFTDILAGVLRTAAASLGGTLVAKGYIDANTASQLGGALVIIGTAGLSALSKINASKKV